MLLALLPFEAKLWGETPPSSGEGRKGAALYVGSYNIRNKNNSDSINGNVWTKRCQVLCDLLNFEQPDIFGTQECFIWQIRDMEARLDGYRHIGVARDDGKERGEHSAIFYKKDKLRLLRSGDFWLSETPDKPGLGWDAACIRICTWGHFRHLASGREFLFFSLHMDHVGKKARMESARLVMRKMQELGSGLPAILVGDFNVDQNSDEYKSILDSGIFKDAYQAAEFRHAPNGTFNGFNPSGYTTSRIDHMFLSPVIKVKKYAILTDTYRTRPEGYVNPPVDPYSTTVMPYVARTPSDHYPVRIEVEF